jgi:hypothetical protein
VRSDVGILPDTIEIHPFLGLRRRWHRPDLGSMALVRCVQPADRAAGFRARSTSGSNRQ